MKSSRRFTAQVKRTVGYVIDLAEARRGVSGQLTGILEMRRLTFRTAWPPNRAQLFS